MSDELLRLVVGAVILIHGIAHVGAIGALLWIRAGHDTGAGSWAAARTWIAPVLSPQTAMTLAIGLYGASLVGFVFTALAFWGIVLPIAWWGPFGVASALISTTGIVVFFGTWPMLNMVAAVVVNIGVILAVVLGWPSASVIGG